MMTKTQYCKHVITQFCYEEGISRDELCDSHVLSSSELGIAMKFLGLLKDEEMKTYIQGRAGTHILGVQGGLLTSREFLGLLPE